MLPSKDYIVLNCSEKPLSRMNSRSRRSSCSHYCILTRFLRFCRISRHANGSIVDRLTDWEGCWSWPRTTGWQSRFVLIFLGLLSTLIRGTSNNFRRQVMQNLSAMTEALWNLPPVFRHAAYSNNLGNCKQNILRYLAGTLFRGGKWNEIKSSSDPPPQPSKYVYQTIHDSSVRSNWSKTCGGIEKHHQETCIYVFQSLSLRTRTS